eukprot:3050593-Amphidinium_carterae.1
MTCVAPESSNAYEKSGSLCEALALATHGSLWFATPGTHTHYQLNVSFGVSVACKISHEHWHRPELVAQRMLKRPVAVEAYPSPFPDHPCHLVLVGWVFGICLSSPCQGAWKAHASVVVDDHNPSN